MRDELQTNKQVARRLLSEFKFIGPGPAVLEDDLEPPAVRQEIALQADDRQVQAQGDGEEEAAAQPQGQAQRGERRDVPGHRRGPRDEKGKRVRKQP